MDHTIWLESKYFGQAANAGYQNLLIFTHQKRHNNLPHPQFYVIVPFYTAPLNLRRLKAELLASNECSCTHICKSTSK